MFKISSNISASFDQIANDLFNNYIIKVNDNFYRLLEIEFYYNDSKDHNDSYTHGHKWQSRSGYWYVHGSGIDISIGSESASGGILLRSIQKLSPKPSDEKEQYVFGPQKVLTELISGLNSCFDSKANVFALVPPADHSIAIDKVPVEEIIQCGRIGLSAKDEKYKNAPYRYLIYPKLKHKEKTQIALALKDKWGSTKDKLDDIRDLLGSEFLKEFR